MLALSIREPYAWFILDGRKKPENRDSNSVREPSVITQARQHVGERIAIQASKTWAVDQQITLGVKLQSDITKDPHILERVEREIRAGLGSIVGTAVIDRIIRHDDGDPLNVDEWRTDDRFAICFRDPVRLDEPVPAKGALGLWRVPDDIAALVRRQLPSGALTEGRAP